MFIKVQKRLFFNTDFIANNVLDIDYDYLKDIGIEAVAFDIDGTLTRQGSNTIDNNFAINLIDLLNKASINKRFIATNSNRDMSNIISNLKGFTHINSKGTMPKPFKSYYINLQKAADVPANKIVMIGDRWLQDVWGSRKSGLKSVYVCLDPELVTNKDKIFLRHIWQPKLVKQ
jgi:predicted HAD superfamily phosphohydrolase YqeG